MLYREHKDDDFSLIFTAKEYKHILDCAVSSHIRRGMRLGGHGLRCAEALRSVRGDLYQEESTGDYYLRVRDCKKSDYNSTDPIPDEPLPAEKIEFRHVRISDGLAEEILVELEDADNETRLLNNIGSRSTYDRKINQSGEIAAKRADEEMFEYVSHHDMRRYFAMQLAIRAEDIDPKLVLKWGGWSSIESLLDYIVIPPDYAKSQLERAGFYGNSIDLYDPRDADQLNKILLQKVEDHYEELPTQDVERKDVHKLIKKIEEKTSYKIEIVGSSNSKEQKDNQFENPSAQTEFNVGDDSHFSMLDPVAPIWSAIVKKLNPVVHIITEGYTRFEQVAVQIAPVQNQRAQKAYDASLILFFLLLFTMSVDKFMMALQQSTEIAPIVIIGYVYLVVLEISFVES